MSRNGAMKSVTCCSCTSVVSRKACHGSRCATSGWSVPMIRSMAMNPASRIAPRRSRTTFSQLACTQPRIRTWRRCGSLLTRCPVGPRPTFPAALHYATAWRCGWAAPPNLLICLTWPWRFTNKVNRYSAVSDWSGFCSPVGCGIEPGRTSKGASTILEVTRNACSQEISTSASSKRNARRRLPMFYGRVIASTLTSRKTVRRSAPLRSISSNGALLHTGPRTCCGARYSACCSGMSFLLTMMRPCTRRLNSCRPRSQTIPFILRIRPESVTNSNFSKIHRLRSTRC